MVGGHASSTYDVVTIRGISFRYNLALECHI
jgi:hypothetical protein